VSPTGNLRDQRPLVVEVSGIWQQFIKGAGVPFFTIKETVSRFAAMIFE